MKLPDWVDGIYKKDRKIAVLEMKETEKTQAEEIKQALSSLPERERAVITMRFGLEDGVPMTLNEVAEVFGITKERVRQIEAMALRKLRHPEGKKK